MGSGSPLPTVLERYRQPREALSTCFTPFASMSPFPWLLRPAPETQAIQSGQREQMAHALRPIPEEVHCLLPLVTDTHNHMAGYDEEERKAFCNEINDVNANPKPTGAKQYVVMSVGIDDWELGERVSKNSQFQCAFGVHPQCAADVDCECALEDGGWFCPQLTEYLERNPCALVGEIGLDRNTHFKWCYESDQVPLFLAQLRLAGKLSRPISVHSVKADGPLVELLQKEAKGRRPLPPRVCLHSFGGSLETLYQIIQAVEKHAEDEDLPRVYIGFNAWTNLWKKQATNFLRSLVGHGGIHDPRLGAFRKGKQRILLESDWNPADFVFEGSQRQDVDKILLNGLIKIGEILEMAPNDVADMVAVNTEAFMSGWRPADSQGKCPEELTEESEDEEEDSEETCGDFCTKDEVDSLSPKALRSAVKARGLCTEGELSELRQRLLDSMSPTLSPDFGDVLRELDKML